MKFPARFVALVVLTFPAVVLAQSNSANPAATAPLQTQNQADPAGDTAWAAVAALQKSMVSPSGAVTAAPTLPTPAQSQARVQLRAQSSRQTAGAAKDFHTRFPTHAQAPAARKLEALSGIAGITADDKPNETAALKVAGDFRTNRTNPISDRYEVAHSVERHVVGRKLGGKSWLSAPAESEPMADRLREEFGNLPEVYGNYLAVARNTNCDHSKEIAQRILRMPAPASVKADAQRVLDRARLMRKPLDFPLTPTTGAPTRLATLAGGTAGVHTVVVFWDGTRSPSGPPGLHDFKRTPPPNTKWIYVSLGAWTPVSATQGAPAVVAAPGDAANGKAKGGPPISIAKASAAPPGTYCVEPLGLRSPVALQMNISSLPFVCVLDDKKNLNAFGRVDEIPALLAGINRLIEP